LVALDGYFSFSSAHFTLARISKNRKKSGFKVAQCLILLKPRPNAVKFFNAVELMALLADPDWLDDATKTIIQHWKRMNARRNGLPIENRVSQSIV